MPHKDKNSCKGYANQRAKFKQKKVRMKTAGPKFRINNLTFKIMKN